MEVKAVTNHRVEIHQSDIAEWFEANVGDIDPSTLKIAEATDGLVVCIPVSERYLDTFLRTVIDNLPQSGYYEWEVLPYSSDVVGVITWTN